MSTKGHPDSPFLAAAVERHHGVRSTIMASVVRGSATTFEPGVERGVVSMRLPRGWNDSTGKKCSSNGCCLETEHGCDRRVVRVGVWP